MIVLGADHAGFSLKEALKKYLITRDLDLVDQKPQFDLLDDYPDVAQRVALRVKNGGNIGVLVCGSGVGMSIVANKVPAIRAALCRSEEDAKLSRLHNDANILCLGGSVTSKEMGVRILKTFLDTPFSDEERHARRIKKIKRLE